MTTSTKIPHTGAVLKMPRQNKGIATFATSIVNAMTGNASFPSPTPPLATVTADIAAFEAAEAAVLSRTKGAAVARNEKLATLKVDLAHEMAYVQEVADANPANSQSIIESAGMSVRKTASRPKNALTVELAAVSGSVKLVAKAVSHRAGYEWQYSTDQKTWISAPVTLQAKTEITGLTPATTYYFRVRGVTKAGEGGFSQTVSILVA
jgi:Fibronectin type III domain